MSDTSVEAPVDGSRASALFAALGLGPIDADESGCFVMRYDAQTSLHFQIVPEADLLKVAISVCSLRLDAAALRTVLRSNLDALRTDRTGTLSIVPTTGQVLFNAILPIAVAETESTTRPLQAQEFGAVLEAMLDEALRFRRKLTRELDAASVPVNMEDSHVIRA